MNESNSLKKTAKEFEKSFLENKYYNLQTQDPDHLSLIMKRLKIEPGKRILDLGTGSGYLAFYIAKTNPQCIVAGLDIVEKTILRNAANVKQKKIKNLDFFHYNGINFPFDNNAFDIIIARYALHHFPNIKKCFSEISRILNFGGQLFISDPTPNEIDSDGFVNKYMQMKDDGHIKFYKLDEFKELGKNKKLIFESNDMTKIRFPRKEADKYNNLLNFTDKNVLTAYNIEIINDEVFITEDVLNISFLKSAL